MVLRSRVTFIDLAEAFEQLTNEDKRSMSNYYLNLFPQAKRTLKAQKLQEELASGKLMDQAVSVYIILNFLDVFPQSFFKHVIFAR